MIDAFAKLLADGIGGIGDLHIVGDGPERADLHQIASSLGVADRVQFHGHHSSVEKLAPLYWRSVVSVSPGYVGLSLTQSLLFGVPMLIADTERHAPEISLLVEGWNGATFRSGDSRALANAVRALWVVRSEWSSRASEIAASARAEYTVEGMADGFLAAALAPASVTSN